MSGRAVISPKWFLMLVLILSPAACSLLPERAAPKAAEMLPELSGYNTVEGQQLTPYISGLAGGASLLVGQPELAAAALAIDRVIACYQQSGAVAARVYSSQSMPLSAGAVAIADRNALLDPVNLFNCVARPVVGEGAGLVDIEPCSASYTLEKEGNVYYIIYAGTTAEICGAFCAQLEGCTVHP